MMALVMRRLLLIFAAVLGVAAPSSAAADSTTASASVRVNAEFSTRTSLKVSSQVLQFAVPAGGETARVDVDFSAGARTRAGGEVLLLVESLGAIDDGLEGATEVTVAAQGQAACGGRLAVNVATPVARWIGSGLRTGRVTFTMRAVAGLYTVPVRFLLTAP
jgi:hypothetical protein